MIQSWLTIGGLAFDFSGFALLLREWWLAFFNEGMQIEAEEQLERMRQVCAVCVRSAVRAPTRLPHSINFRMTRPFAAPERPTNQRWQLAAQCSC